MNSVNQPCSIIRTRRIKCDESRPQCTQCIDFGFECDGYGPVHKEPISNSKVNAQNPDTPQNLVSKSSIQLSICKSRIRTGPHFTDEEQGRYFRFYYEDIAAEIRGPFVTTLWETTIPQSGEVEPYILHAIVAIGALKMSNTTNYRSRTSEMASKGGSSFDLHHQYALLQYGKALKGMRIAIENNSQDIRKSLIACILVFCVESLLGRQSAACSHASSGVNLLYRCHRKSPTYNIFDTDDLHSAFTSLDLQALLLVNTQTLEIHKTLKTGLDIGIKSMPPLFTSVKECQMFWHMIMRRNLHFIATAREKTYVSAIKGAAAEDSLHVHTNNNPCNAAYINPGTIPAIITAEQDSCLADIRSWELASTPLFSKSTPGSGDYFITTLLQIQATLTVILLGQTFLHVHPPEIDADRWLEEFRTITTLTSSIQQYLVSPSSSFHFDAGIIPALGAAGSQCRDPQVRGHAIKLLLSAPGYREGIWDSLSVGMICDWKRKIEEEFLDENGYVPAFRRGTMTSMKISLPECTAHVALKQWAGDDASGFVIRNETIKW